MKSSGGERDENGCWDDENGTKKTVPPFHLRSTFPLRQWN